MTDKREVLEEAKIIIPVIRSTMPDILAEALLSVQPMYSPHSKEEWPYQIDVLPFAKYSDVIPMKTWCQETLDEGDWIASVQFFAFKTEEALNWFKLRWL
jgi:hypothetical protein